MACTIHVNGTTNSLVHKGSMGIAKSTLPDVCKTPSPGGPIPIPYPIIVSMSSDLKKGTKKVKFDSGNSAAIKGSEFSRCTGDEPGTAGGVVSSTNMKEATWILYSFDVKIEGKNACRLSDKMMMNHGNTACLSGTVNPAVSGAKDKHKCGEVAGYSKLKRSGKAAPDYERDHIPSKAALFARAESTPPAMKKAVAKRVKKCVEARGVAVAIPKTAHRGFSPTCGSKNTRAQISGDAGDLNKAKKRDLKAMKQHLKGGECEAAYKKAAKKIEKFDHEAMIKQCKKDCLKERWW